MFVWGFCVLVYHLIHPLPCIEQKLGWISRVPATINEEKELLAGDSDMIPAEDSRYTLYTTGSNYGCIEQR